MESGRTTPVIKLLLNRCFMKMKTTLSLISPLLFVGVIVVAYHAGYRKGRLYEQIARVPFDLECYLQLHKMSEFIDSIGKHESISFHKDNAKILLYSTIRFYDTNKERFSNADKYGHRFEENVYLARRIVQDLELVCVETAVKKSVKGVSAGRQGHSKSAD